MPGAWHGTLLEDKRDKVGTLYMRNRSYDPNTGRFTQEDPIGLAGGPNVYAYVGGDPTNFSDPFGLCRYIPNTDAPCELFAAVFSEAGRRGNVGAEAKGIAHAIINRALDVPRHRYCAFTCRTTIRNSGNLFNDVARHAISRDIQGTTNPRNTQFLLAWEIMAYGVPGDADGPTARIWNTVVASVESAYDNPAGDNTQGATYWAHGMNPTRGGSGPDCRARETVTINGARFAACVVK